MGKSEDNPMGKDPVVDTHDNETIKNEGNSAIYEKWRELEDESELQEDSQEVAQKSEDKSEEKTSSKSDSLVSLVIHAQYLIAATFPFLYSLTVAYFVVYAFSF